MAGRAPVIPKKKGSESQSQPQQLPLEEQIRIRAHALYLARGGADGAEVDDWLQAEQEILGQQSPKAAE